MIVTFQMFMAYRLALRTRSGAENVFIMYSAPRLITLLSPINQLFARVKYRVYNYYFLELNKVMLS